MDAEQISEVSRLVAPPPRPQKSGEGSSGSSARPVEAPAAEDTVSLSTEGRRALEGGEPSGNGGAESTTREFDVTEQNQVILKIKEQSTNKVIKQIPSEDQLALRRAIQKGVESLGQNV